MGSTAIVYSSSLGGNVRKVAQYLASNLGADIFDLKNQTNIILDDFDTVIIGTGVHFGKPYSKVTDFVNTNREILQSKRTVLFISCMFSGTKGQDQAREIADEYRIADFTFFPSTSEKDTNGITIEQNAFLGRMRK